MAGWRRDDWEGRNRKIQKWGWMGEMEGKSELFAQIRWGYTPLQLPPQILSSSLTPPRYVRRT